MSTAVLTVLNETHKGLIITLGYKANIITDTGQQVVIFIALGFFMGRGQLDPEPLAAMLIGYLLWYYAAIALTIDPAIAVAVATALLTISSFALALVMWKDGGMAAGHAAAVQRTLRSGRCAYRHVFCHRGRQQCAMVLVAVDTWHELPARI